MLSHRQQQQYNGTEHPQVILISPIAHEELGGFLPDPSTSNRYLKEYVKAMEEVAGDLDVPFIDLYAPTAGIETGPDSLTINGINLNDRGYRELRQLTARTKGLPQGKGNEQATN